MAPCLSVQGVASHHSLSRRPRPRRRSPLLRTPHLGSDSRRRNSHRTVGLESLDRLGAGNRSMRVNARLHHIGIGRTHTRTHASCSFRTSTSESSTPPPEYCCANSFSTPPRTTNPPEDHPAPPPNTPNSKQLNPRIVGSAVADVLRHHKAEGVGFEPTMTVTRHTGFQDQRTRPLCEPSRRTVGEPSGLPIVEDSAPGRRGGRDLAAEGRNGCRWGGGRR